MDEKEKPAKSKDRKRIELSSVGFSCSHVLPNGTKLQITLKAPKAPKGYAKGVKQ